jgi:hypothetical protein
VFVVLRFAVTGSPDEFVGAAHEGLRVLAQCLGYRHGQLARAYDDPEAWCLVVEWDSVGAYRRALSSAQVKLRLTPLLAGALPEASAFETLAVAGPDGEVTVLGSDRAAGR